MKMQSKSPERKYDPKTNCHWKIRLIVGFFNQFLLRTDWWRQSSRIILCNFTFAVHEVSSRFPIHFFYKRYLAQDIDDIDKQVDFCGWQGVILSILRAEDKFRPWLSPIPPELALKGIDRKSLLIYPTISFCVQCAASWEMKTFVFRSFWAKICPTNNFAI